MKLTRCDVCGEIVKEREAGEIHYKEGAFGSVYIQTEDGGYMNIDEVHSDICRKCAISVLKIIKPKYVFKPIEDYQK